MSCLRPISIKIDNRVKYDSSALRKVSHFGVSASRYRDIRPYTFDRIDVPCGKCIECLKARQNALVSRCIAESEKRGSFIFVTLTYDDEHLPIAQSLWRVSRETGLYELVSKGEIVVSARDSDEYVFNERRDEIRKLFRSVVPSDRPRYIETSINGFSLFDEEYDYVARLTPSISRKDVRLWIKKARVYYERKFGEKLPDFSYVACSEYGPKTCRPHYHLAFFGLNASQVAFMTDLWTYGYKMVKSVNRVNSDGSDGFAIASKYIGKYMTKGKFDCQSVKDCSAEKPRICQSIGIGRSLIDRVRSFVCAFDMYGEYDLDTFFCPPLGRCLNENELKQVVEQIPKRLYYQVNDKLKLPIPKLFKYDIFKVKKVFYDERNRADFDVSGNVTIKKEKVPCTMYFPTSLWRLVSASISEHFTRDDNRKFESYISSRDFRGLESACSSFAFYSESCNVLSESPAEARYIEFLNHSKF